MKLVLEEYLKTLREKDELDLLLCDLLLLDGYTSYNHPKTGERQYGVDALARKDNDTYLFVIKQKDIDRASWDSNQNSVRQSLNDIIDVYLKTMLPSQYKNDCIHIVVVTNGYLKASVQPNFNGYQQQHNKFEGIPLNIEIWNIDDLVHLCDRVAFSEVLFDSNVQSILRKSLYYMDESDFSNRYFENMVDHYIDLFETNKNHNKVFTSFFTCITLMSNWARNLKRYKIAIDLLEYCLIKIWQLMLNNGYFEKNNYVYWLNRFIVLYKQNNDLYVQEIDEICEIKNALLHSHIIEDRLLIYEIIGRLSTYGLFNAYIGKTLEAQNITDILIKLLNNNQQYKYPVYDNNIIELSLMFLLIKHCQHNDLSNLIECIIIGLLCPSYMPSPNDSLEEAIDIQSNNIKVSYDASILYNGLLEWTCIENMGDVYTKLQQHINKNYRGIACQTWQMNNDEESIMYSHNYAHLSGACIVFPTTVCLEEFKKCINASDDNINFDDFSFNKYCNASIALIASRYYHQPVIPQFWRRFKPI